MKTKLKFAFEFIGWDFGLGFLIGVDIGIAIFIGPFMFGLQAVEDGSEVSTGAETDAGK